MKKTKTKNNRDRMFQLISIVFAILLWSYVRSEVDPERTIVYKNMDVSVENLAELKENNLSVIISEKPTTDVTLRGRQSVISKLDRTDVKASVDLSGYVIGDHKIPIKVQVDSTNVIVESKNPSNVSVKVDENISKQLEVDLKIKGNPAENFVLGNIKQAEFVTVSGAKTYVDSIDKIIAVANVSNKKESSVMSIPIIAYDKEGNEIENIEIEPEKIDFEIPILKTETVPVKLNVVGEVPEGVDSKKFSIYPDSVSIKGNTAVINKITEISTTPITVEELMSGQIPVEVEMPNGISLVDNDVKFIASASEIVLEEQEVKIPIKNIKILNLDTKLEFIEDVETVDSIDITIVAKDPSSREVLNVEDVTASMDFLNLKAGKHEIQININLPEKFRVTKITPKSIVVELVKKRIF